MAPEVVSCSSCSSVSAWVDRWVSAIPKNDGVFYFFYVVFFQQHGNVDTSLAQKGV
jgi:hypothetical protein